MICSVYQTAAKECADIEFTLWTSKYFAVSANSHRTRWHGRYILSKMPSLTYITHSTNFTNWILPELSVKWRIGDGAISFFQWYLYLHHYNGRSWIFLSNRNWASNCLTAKHGSITRTMRLSWGPRRNGPFPLFLSAHALAGAAFTFAGSLLSKAPWAFRSQHHTNGGWHSASAVRTISQQMAKSRVLRNFVNSAPKQRLSRRGLKKRSAICVQSERRSSHCGRAQWLAITDNRVTGKRS